MPSIEQLITEWRAWLIIMKGHRDKGVRWYGYVAKNFFAWLETAGRWSTLDQVSRQDIEAWQKALFFEMKNISSTSRANKLACVRSFLTWCVQAGHLTVNPSEGIPSPRIQEVLPQKFSAHELDLLFSAPDLTTHVGVRDQAMLRLLYAAGPRASELINLDLNHIQEYSGKMRVTFKKTKGGKDRVFTISETPSKAIRMWLVIRSGIETPSRALFVNTKRPYNRITYNGLNDTLHKYAEQMGIPNADVFLHKMRATFATDLYDSGDDCCARCKAPVRSVDLLTVQIALGHNDPKTTLKYISVSERYLKKLAIPESRYREIERGDR